MSNRDIIHTMNKKIDLKTLKKAANLLLFDLTEAQYEVLLEEFSILQAQMEVISHIPHLDDLEPLFFPYEVFTTKMREDIPTLILTEEEALKNAPHKIDNQVKVPKVL